MKINDFQIVYHRSKRSFLLSSEDQKSGFVIDIENDYLGPLMNPHAILKFGYWDPVTEEDAEWIDTAALQAIYDKRHKDQENYVR